MKISNKKNSIFFLVTFFVTVLFHKTMMAEYTKTTEQIEIGVLDYPPYYIVKDMDKISGCLADLLHAVANEAQLNYRMVGYPGSRLYNNIANGDTQLWFGTKGVPVYDDKVIYSKESLVNLQLGLYRLKGTPEITKKEDLAGKSVLTILGFAYSGFIDFLKDPKNKVQLQSNTTHSGALMMLLNKRGDYLLDYTQTIEGLLKTRDAKNVETTILSNVPLFFVIPKSYPKAQELINKIETAVETLKKKDELKVHTSCSKYSF